ncbi:MAG: ABC transporter ATP-binding protein [Cytophagales bacterium]|nr:MAG: ABC transporter ATP-binding protein [Cytophagales bacterium]TAF61886.1 MAG: ABC transporter ATP-binding protein [Cytophagales bacterium]
MSTLLEAEALSVGYKVQEPILSQINFRLKVGSFVGLFGANGTGKSTLLRTLGGFLPVLSGKLQLEQKKLKDYSNQEKARKIALVFTERIQPPYLTVYEAIKMGRMPYTSWTHSLSLADEKAIQKAIERCNVAHLTHKELANLSDGEYQKVMIARALAQDCPLMLLDEPTAFLDIQHKKNVFKLLANIVKETPTAVVLSTHDLTFCMNYCNQAWLIDAQKKFITYESVHSELIDELLQQICPD